MGGITQPFRRRQRQSTRAIFDKSTNKTNKRSHFPPPGHVCASSAAILATAGNAPSAHSESERERERESEGSDADADADSDTVVNRMTAPNNKVISRPNKLARAPTRQAKAKAKAARAGQQELAVCREREWHVVCACASEAARESAQTGSLALFSRGLYLLALTGNIVALSKQVTTSRVSQQESERAS